MFVKFVLELIEKDMSEVNLFVSRYSRAMVSKF